MRKLIASMNNLRLAMEDTELENEDNAEQAKLSIATRVMNKGFKSFTDAIDYARKINQKRATEEMFAGHLIDNKYLFLNLKGMIRREEKVLITYSEIPGRTKVEKKINLGRMRALARLAALAEGYCIPQLEDNGRFDIHRGPKSYDDNGMQYEAQARKLNSPFWSLDIKDQRELLELAKRKH